MKWNFWAITQFRNHRWTNFQIFSNRSDTHVRTPRDVVLCSGLIVFSMLYCCRLHQSKYSVLDPIREIDFLVRAIARYCRSVNVALLLGCPVCVCVHVKIDNQQNSIWLNVPENINCTTAIGSFITFIAHEIEHFLPFRPLTNKPSPTICK